MNSLDTFVFTDSAQSLSSWPSPSDRRERGRVEGSRHRVLCHAASRRSHRELSIKTCGPQAPSPAHEIVSHDIFRAHKWPVPRDLPSRAAAHEKQPAVFTILSARRGNCSAALKGYRDPSLPNLGNWFFGLRKSNSEDECGPFRRRDFWKPSNPVILTESERRWAERRGVRASGRTPTLCPIPCRIKAFSPVPNNWGTAGALACALKIVLQRYQCIAPRA